jgi:hypothetical protein
MPPVAVSPPAAHGTLGQVRIDGHNVYLCVAEEPVDEIVPGWPQPSLDGDAQLDAYGGRHQPDEGIFEVRCEFLGTRLAEDDRYGS